MAADVLTTAMSVPQFTSARAVCWFVCQSGVPVLSAGLSLHLRVSVCLWASCSICDLFVATDVQPRLQTEDVTTAQCRSTRTHACTHARTMPPRARCVTRRAVWLRSRALTARLTDEAKALRTNNLRC